MSGAGDDRGADGREADLEAELARLRDELADRRLEVLRLRDKLIGTEAELGTALGHVASLHAELSSYAGLPDRYNQVVGSTSWRLMWRVMTPYRKLRERVAPPA